MRRTRHNRFDFRVWRRFLKFILRSFISFVRCRKPSQLEPSTLIGTIVLGGTCYSQGDPVQRVYVKDTLAFHILSALWKETALRQ